MILNKKVLLASICTLLAQISFSQKATIKGAVYSSDSSQKVAGVQVSELNSNVYALSNSYGTFEIELANKPKATLLFLAKGFAPKSIEINGSKDTTITIYLKANINTLDPVLLMSKHSGDENITGSSAYLSPKELEKFASIDANQVLRNIPGIQIQQEDGFGLRPNIGLRATGVERSSKITLMEDGILAAPAPYSAPAAYYFPSIARMEGVEIVKGSSQIKYGPFTTGGAINFISTPIPDQFAAKLRINYGSFNTKDLLVNVGQQGAYFGFMIQSLQQQSDGFKNLPTGLNTGFNKSDYILKLRLRNGTSAKIPQSITLKLGQTLESSNETYLGLNQTDFNQDPLQRYAASQDDQMNSKQSQISLHHQIKINKYFNISTTAYYNQFQRNWYKLNHLTDSNENKVSLSGVLSENGNPYYLSILKGQNSLNERLWLKANNRSYHSKGIQTLGSYKIPTSKGNLHEIELGLRLHQDQIDRFQWQDAYAMLDGFLSLTNKGIAGTESNRVETANAFATYINYRYQTARLEIKPGLRLENINQGRLDYGKNDVNRMGAQLKERNNQTQSIMPGIGINYDLKKGKSVFLGLHKGFAPAGSGEGAKPETSNNIELGLNVQTTLLSGQAVAFFSHYQNLLGSDLNASGGTGTGDLFNGGEAESYGLEISATTTKLFSKSKDITFPITLGYTFTEAQFKSSFSSSFEGWGTVNKNDHLPYFSPHQVFVNLSLEHSKFSINLSTKYNDAMRTQPGQGGTEPNLTIPSSVFSDINFQYALYQRVKVSTSVTNMLNNTNAVSLRPYGLRPAMPRMVRIGINITL